MKPNTEATLRQLIADWVRDAHECNKHPLQCECGRVLLRAANALLDVVINDDLTERTPEEVPE